MNEKTNENSPAGTPKISVIVPVYNAEKFLRECIDSILSQSFSDFELILVDDGSTDNSGEICDEYASRDSRVRVFHKQNGGVSNARNLGIECSRGQWIAFVDSDDSVAPDYLKNLYGNTKNPTDFPVSGQFVCDGNGEKNLEVGGGNAGFVDINSGTNGKTIFAKKQWKTLFSSGALYCKLFNREILLGNALRLDPRISISEDRVFFLRYLQFVRRVIFTGTSDYFYFRRAGSTSLNSLSNPRENLLAGNLLKPLIFELDKIWKFSASQGKKLVHQYVWSAFHDAIFYAYEHAEHWKISEAEALAILREIYSRERISFAAKYYSPSSFKKKLMKWFFICVPVTILHVVLKKKFHSKFVER